MKKNNLKVELIVKKIDNEKFFIVLVNVFFDKEFDIFLDAYLFLVNIAISRLNKKGGDAVWEYKKC